MSFSTRLAVFLALACAGLVAWQWSAALDASHDAAQLAVRQFQNDDAVAADLRHASVAQNWWPFVGPALLIIIACVMFWEDVERLWKHDEL